jgi:pimeloyl-ACP methyl ester carboxylesterase
MEPRIQYAKTSDRLNIAYFVLGEGTPLLLMPTPPISHVGKATSVPSLWSFLTGLAEACRLVVYDGRGFGMSDRDPPEFSIETQIVDLETVVDHIGIERFAILGHFDSSPAAIAFASRHPERVARLVLWSGYASGAEQSNSAEFEAMIALMNSDWSIFTQLISNMVMGSSPPADIAAFAEFVRESAGPDAFRASWRAAIDFDVRDLLPQLSVPTLVMDRQGSRGLDLSRKLASSIPDAELCILGSGGLAEWAGTIPAVVQAIQEFIARRHLVNMTSRSPSARYSSPTSSVTRR